jgi:hypothetical protein
MVKKKRGSARKRKIEDSRKIEPLQEIELRENEIALNESSSEFLMPEKFVFSGIKGGISNNEFSFEPYPAVKNEAIAESEKEPKKEKKREIKILVWLIIILLVVDILSLFFYFQPDLSGFFKFSGKVAESSNNSKCRDGTGYGSCSKNKPLYCYNGELVKKAATCGCPSGSAVNFQDCKKV